MIPTATGDNDDDFHEESEDEPELEPGGSPKGIVYAVSMLGWVKFR